MFSGDPEGDGLVGIRLGTIDGDPTIRLSWRQWVSSAPAWESIPEDGLKRFSEGKGPGHRADR